MTDHAHDISILNGLIEAMLDSCDGYREAAEQAKNVMMAELFRHWATQRRQVTRELRETVRALGGEPQEDGTVLASAHRVFLDLRAHMSRTNMSVVQEVERGEDHIKHKFERALMDRKIGVVARLAVQSAYVSVKSGHDDMRNLKRSYD